MNTIMYKVTLPSEKVLLTEINVLGGANFEQSALCSKAFSFEESILWRLVLRKVVYLQIGVEWRQLTDNPKMVKKHDVCSELSNLSG